MKDNLRNIVASTSGEGMRSFTFSLAEMIEQELIYYDTAMEFAPNRDGLASAVKGIKVTQQTIVKTRGR